MRFATAETTDLPAERASVLFDGALSEPRLAHPEGVAVGPDGAVWCGTETGGIMRLAADGSGIEAIATTGGFALGIAFDGRGGLFVCDLKHACVFRLDLDSRALEAHRAEGMRIPNYPVVDGRRGVLYVSDSHAFDTPGPGIWRMDLATGRWDLWFPHDLVFANGMALSRDGNSLFVIETFARRISRVPIGPDGAADAPVPVAQDLPGLPDGLAVTDADELIVGCYEPSRLLRIAADGSVTVHIEDVTAHTLCHPTNLALDGSTLYTANLGRWHVTRIETTVSAPRLWPAAS
ncbi:MAG: SMP-30/gluconolactonase/LRE family protein [Azospirillaceae bacterium]